MKKKAVVAMLIMCMAVSAAACGKSSDTEKTTTETTDTKDSEDSKEDSTDTDIKETDSSEGNRLVSVKDVSKYVTIGEYKGLDLNRTSQSVTDDDVQAEINYDLEDNGTEVKDGTVENGDTVTINFTGTIDGKEFDGGSAEDYELVVGDGGMIDGFEDGIVGMKSGETKELDLTFPDDYYEESVAGKAVVFKVTLQKFTRPAELTDEWVAANTDYDSVYAVLAIPQADPEYQKKVTELYSSGARNVLQHWNHLLITASVDNITDAEIKELLSTPVANRLAVESFISEGLQRMKGFSNEYFALKDYKTNFDFTQEKALIGINADTDLLKDFAYNNKILLSCNQKAATAMLFIKKTDVETEKALEQQLNEWHF